MKTIGRLVLGFALSLVPCLTAMAQDTFTTFDPGYSADRVIVGWRSAAAKSPQERARKLAQSRAPALKLHDSIDANTDVLTLDRTLSGIALDAFVKDLEQDANVAYASPDLRRHPHALTSDTRLYAQWYLFDQQPAATKTYRAWDITTGSPSVIVAVVDTGVRFDHPDLGRVATGGKLLPGYDFVSNATYSNDGDGRDADASDPGDWVDDADLAQSGFAECKFSLSSWHGTRVSGLIGAATNNGEGVAGAAYDTRILPVRVMGKCGGFDSDIIAGMRWAAGLPVSGVPNNPTPARIVNLSLGGSGTCSAAYSAAVNEIVAHGALVVVSAGNEGGPVNSPANCEGVLAVTGIRHVGTKTGLSNFGPQIGIAAPSGNCITLTSGSCQFPIVVAQNDGRTTPTTSSYTDSMQSSVGTSFSAPQVSAAAALMHSVNAKLSPAQLVTLLQNSSTPFPTSAPVPQCVSPSATTNGAGAECACTSQTCGAGMLNTVAAVLAAQAPLAIMHTSGTARIGSTLTLNGAESIASNDRSVTGYAWTIADLVGPAPSILAPQEANTTLQIQGAGSFTLKLTVTDDHGSEDTAVTSFSIASSGPTPATPASASSRSGGGGGGGFDFGLLAVLLGLARASSRSRVVLELPGVR